MTLDDHIEAIRSLSLQVQANRAGSLFAIVVSEEEGYAETALERELRGHCDQVISLLRAHPAELTSQRLESLLASFLNCRNGITLHTARLLRYAGDWGDNASPIANAVLYFMEELTLIIRKLGPSGKGIVKGVNEVVLNERLTLYYDTDSCDRAEVTKSLREHLAITD